MHKKWKSPLLLALLGAVLFSIFFHRRALGLNVFLFEMVILVGFSLTKEYKLRGRLALTAAAGLLGTAVFTILTHSVFVYVMNFIALAVYLGVLIYPSVKSYVTALGLFLLNIMEAQAKFLTELMRAKVKGKGIGSFLWKSRIFTVPLVIIVVFLIIYSASNSVFENMLGNVGEWISTQITALFKDFDALVIATFLLGLGVCNLFLFRVAHGPTVEFDGQASDALTRRKQTLNKNFKPNSLKNEYRAGVFLFITLNGILMLLNVIDINWVWFNFDWQAQDLKQFVHEGTYLLILSILLSVALVLYFFRRNLNFYSHNKVLKYLSLAWIVQNGILAVSVAIRNFIYIDHFALAYKRIGVIIFLLLTLYGLYTVFAKVFQRKSAFYLLRANAYSIFVVLIVCSFVNWDRVIARYNFSHGEKSWLHLEFLSHLSYKALPELDVSFPELVRLDQIQDRLFPFSQDYLSPQDYRYIIQVRKAEFVRAWEAKGILEWNLAEYRAYEEIIGADDL